jgi:hypothetical protein
MERNLAVPLVIPSSPTVDGSKRGPWQSARWRSASKICEYCGREFHPWTKMLPDGRIRVMKEHDWKRQRFCSISCSKRLENPMADLSTRCKMRTHLRQRGHCPRVRGGNGQELTVPQQALLAALGEGWVPEFIVPTKMPRHMEWPTHYKIDLAHPDLRIALEIDGYSHSITTRRAQDRRKTAFLAERGWHVLRVTNAQALVLSTTCTSPGILLSWLTESSSITAT